MYCVKHWGSPIVPTTLMEILVVFLGHDQENWLFPPDIAFLVLRYAGLADRGRKMSFFVIWS